MEEFVGGLWHRFITRAARQTYPEAAVRLETVERMAGVMFRAFGGDPGLRVTAAAHEQHGARRRWLARLAHVDDTVAHARRDAQTLSLPPELALFPDTAANRDLYLWLIAQAAATPDHGASWIVACQQATLATLARYPGLRRRYDHLVEAVLALRLPVDKLPPDEAAAETAIRQALTRPGTVDHLPEAKHPPQPVPLWVYPTPAIHDSAPHREGDGDGEDRTGDDPQTQDASQKRRKAKREDSPTGHNALILPFRAESLLSFGEYVKVNRGLDDDPEANAGFADDMNELAIAPNGERAASKVRFDLDLPSEAVDDTPLKTGILLPEWDWKQRRLKPDQCCVTLFDPKDAAPCTLPDRLARPARKVRRQFEAIAPGRRWLRNQPDGSEADLDACVRALADHRAGHRVGELASYLACERRERDLASLVLADLSMSTDAWVDNDARVIDVIRDSLMLFAEALAAIGDRFALYGFSSRRREHIRFSRIKDFREGHGPHVLGRIQALRPGFYTRMGAGIRQATSLLARQPANLRLLLILSDGKPNDLDHYEGRYGIEDTRMSLVEARQAGLKPFCVTIDREGAGYLPHLFGPDGFMVVRKPSELPLVLPRLYSRLTDA